jgi:hypothetical protein
MLTEPFRNSAYLFAIIYVLCELPRTHPTSLFLHFAAGYCSALRCCSAMDVIMDDSPPPLEAAFAAAAAAMINASDSHTAQPNPTSAAAATRNSSCPSTPAAFPPVRGSRFRVRARFSDSESSESDSEVRKERNDAGQFGHISALHLCTHTFYPPPSPPLIPRCIVVCCVVALQQT